ncbi:unnamed protein product, partial [Tenebrio molitor]
IRSRSRSGRRAPGPRPRVTSPTITDGDEVQSPTDLKVTLPTDNNRSRIGARRLDRYLFSNDQRSSN